MGDDPYDEVWTKENGEWKYLYSRKEKRAAEEATDSDSSDGVDSTPKERYSNIVQNDELTLLIGTVAGESLTEGKLGWTAVCNVIVNQLNTDKFEFRNRNTITDVINKGGFSGENGPNAKAIIDYMKNGEASNEKYDNLIETACSAYRGELTDITDGAHFYYAPKRVSMPNHIKRGLDPDFTDAQYVETYVSGLSLDDFRFLNV